MRGSFVFQWSMFANRRAPSQQVLDEFQQREDARIMGSETPAIAAGLATFAGELRGRRVVVWSDNWC